MKTRRLVLASALLSAGVWAKDFQDQHLQRPEDPGSEFGPGQRSFPPGGPEGPNRPPMDRMFHVGPRGRWWTDPELVQKLNLSPDQQKRMDGLFQQSRIKLIDLNATLQKEEALLDPILSADHLDETKAQAQIDRVAGARAELEKATGRMLLGLRGVLTADQWRRLQSQDFRGHDRR